MFDFSELLDFTWGFPMSRGFPPGTPASFHKTMQMRKTGNSKLSMGVFVNGSLSLNVALRWTVPSLRPTAAGIGCRTPHEPEGRTRQVSRMDG